MRTFRFRLLIGGILLACSPALAGALRFQAEGGALWFSRNDVRIPGEGGTRFDLLDLTGRGPDPFVRLYATYDFNPRHSLRVTVAPLEVAGTGILKEDVTFKDDLFPAGIPTRGTYRFNTYRLTYRRTFHGSGPWSWGLGAAVLVRDADITLEQGERKQSRDDLGLVPLLHAYAKYRFSDRASVHADVEGAWSPAGRAFDAAVKGQYDFDTGWHLAAGYRTLEGGADNDSVYTFAWLHYAMVEIGVRF